eukprot:1149977-Pelagomonas_calceolata.AAC.3
MDLGRSALPSAPAKTAAMCAPNQRAHNRRLKEAIQTIKVGGMEVGRNRQLSSRQGKQSK